MSEAEGSRKGSETWGTRARAGLPTLGFTLRWSGPGDLSAKAGYIPYPEGTVVIVTSLALPRMLGFEYVYPHCGPVGSGLTAI